MGNEGHKIKQQTNVQLFNVLTKEPRLVSSVRPAGSLAVSVVPGLSLLTPSNSRPILQEAEPGALGFLQSAGSVLPFSRPGTKRRGDPGRFCSAPSAKQRY